MRKKARLKNQKGLTLIEFTICFLVALIFFALILMHLEVALKNTKESALRQELANLRRLLQVYYIFNEEYPADVRNLFGQRSKLFGRDKGMFNAEFLRSLAQDEDGYPIDPFGNRYVYDPIQGELRTVSSGYEAW